MLLLYAVVIGLLVGLLTRGRITNLGTVKVKLWPTLVYLENGAEVGRVVRPNNVAEIEAIFSGAKT